MKFRKYIFLSMLVIFISYSTNSFAAIWDYTVTYKAQTEDFNSSREKAMSINRYTALKAVIAKIITMSDFKVIDKLIGEENAYFFEDRLRISNETVVQDFYSVDITYYFNEKKITSFLKQNLIPYVTTGLQNRVLIIPIFNQSFNNNNIWYNIFNNNIQDNKYLSTFFLLRDKDIVNEVSFLNNIKDNVNKINIFNNAEYNEGELNKTNILENDKQERNQLKNENIFENAQLLNKLKEQYNVNDVIIAKLTLEDDVSDEKASNNIPNPNSNIYSLSLKSLNTANIQEFKKASLYEQIQNSVGFSEIEHKNKTIEVTENKNFMVFKVTYNSFIDWMSIYSYIKKIEGVEQVDLSEIGYNYSILKINYHGSLANIIADAALHNIIIDIDNSYITCNGFCY